MTEQGARLNDLRRINTERRGVLDELRKEWNRLNETQDGGISGATLLDQRERALTTEIDVLRSSSSSDGNKADYAQELVDSYDELKETNSVLESEIARKSRRLEDMKELSRQHEQVHEALKRMVPSREQKNEEGVTQTVLQEENEWIRSELAHVARTWEEEDKKRRREHLLLNDSDVDSSGLVKSHKRSKKRHKSAAEDHHNIEGSWSLDQLVLKLTQKFLSSPSNPHLDVDRLPIDPRHADLLRQCHVVEASREHENGICLVDYTL